MNAGSKLAGHVVRKPRPYTRVTREAIRLAAVAGCAPITAQSWLLGRRTTPVYDRVLGAAASELGVHKTGIINASPNPVKEPQQQPWHALLPRDKEEQLFPSVHNAFIILEHEWRHRTIVWNEWKNQIESTCRPPWDPIDTYPDWSPGEWTDQDDVATTNWLARTWGLRLGVANVRKAVLAVARKAPYHPLREWLTSLAWDDTPRVATMLSRYCGAVDTPYTRAVGHMVMIGAVARVMDPGCKLDTMMVIEGPQGVGKSTWVRALVGDENHSEIDLRGRRRRIDLAGRWCYEIADIDEQWRREGGRMKAFVAPGTDFYRQPYSRHAEERQRQCFFIGTTNSARRIHKQTGERRFCRIRFERVLLDEFRRDRDQLWAEAVCRYNHGEDWWSGLQ